MTPQEEKIRLMVKTWMLMEDFNRNDDTDMACRLKYAFETEMNNMPVELRTEINENIELLGG